MNIENKGDQLIITLDCSKEAWDAAPPSKSSGKTKVVAGTGGFLAVNTKQGMARLSVNLIR